MLSYWETKHFLNYDYIIIGSGIVGLSCAAEIKEKEPKANVLILEKGLFPSGASTKNAGFACFGTLTELMHDIKIMGVENMLTLVKNRIKGLHILRERLGDQNIDYRQFGGYELVLNEKDYSEEIDYMNSLLQVLFEGNSVFTFRRDLIKDFGFNKTQVKQLIYNPYEGQINTGKMMQKLTEYVSKEGVRVLTGANVSTFIDNDKNVEVHVNTDDASKVLFTCKKMILATNAFTNKFYPEMQIFPGRGQVLVTKPIPNLKINGTFSFDEGFYYFRNIENRILFGGGRNLAFDEENTTAFGINNNIQNHLISLLRNTILPNTEFEIDQQWSGIMAFGVDKLPITELTSKNVAVGVRLNGMGVALGSKIAKDLVTLVM